MQSTVIGKSLLLLKAMRDEANTLPQHLLRRYCEEKQLGCSMAKKYGRDSNCGCGTTKNGS
jgi:hypothetical protein